MTPDEAVASAGPCESELTTRYGRLAVLDSGRDMIGQFLSRYGEWAWLESVFVASVIADQARVLDVGAFAGTFGLGVARSRPLGFLCAIDANPAIAPLLARNVAANAHCPCVTIEALVAGPEAHAGSGQSEPGNLGSMAFSLDGDPGVAATIRTLTLTGLRAEHGAFDLIKLDIEGMELDALRGDADFLATGQTTLWIEANEDPRSLEVARLLLSWNLALFYFAFPSFNPNNFNGDPEPIFPFAFEAGLLAAPKIPPTLSPELRDAGCILRPIHGIHDLKAALWRTPRWAMAEWAGAATMQEAVALAGRSLRGESFAHYLTSETIASDARPTIWQQLETAHTELRTTQARLTAADALASARLDQWEAEQSRRQQTEQDLRAAAALAGDRSNQLEAEQRRSARVEEELRVAGTLAADRLIELEAEQLRGARLEEDLRIADALAANRLRELEAEQSRGGQLQEALHATAALAAERLDQLQSTTHALNAIRDSTVWRASAPLRRFVSRQPAVRTVLRKARASLGHLRRRTPGAAPVAMELPAFDPGHRELARPYFDSAHYLAANQDVLDAGIDPLDHFLQQGWRERRDPGPLFDVAWYLDVNPDVAAAGINPLLHYIWAGKAENRLPRRPLDAERRCLAAAISPQARAKDWTGAIDRSTPLAPAALTSALSAARDACGLIVAISHDDYAENFGGIQNVIADEQRAFEKAGWCYLHVSPAAPLPLLADPGAPRDYRLRLRLNGQPIGVARFPDLASALTATREYGTRPHLVFHHLLGHVPELLATLLVETDPDPVVWLHDFFALCPSFSLMRNDVKFCAAPPDVSAACTVCSFGVDRRAHAPRMRAFFAAMDPIVLAPSAVTLNFWRRQADYRHAGSAVVPLARLVMTTEAGPIVTPADAPLRVAHLGGVAMHKGWPVFEQLALAHSDDPRYEFYHLGLGGSPSSRYVRDPVRVSPRQPDAMIDAIVRNRIDVVICWSLWPETFSFTVHEALAAGAFVVAREAAGNMWPAIRANAPAQGHAVADASGLFQLFESGEIRARVARAERFRGTLHRGGGTAEYMLNDTARAGMLSDAGSVHR